MSNELISISNAEKNILKMIRTMELFDRVEIKYAQRGELQWQLIKTHRGTYSVDRGTMEEI